MSLPSALKGGDQTETVGCMSDDVEEGQMQLKMGRREFRWQSAINEEGWLIMMQLLTGIIDFDRSLIGVGTRTAQNRTLRANGARTRLRYRPPELNLCG